MQCLVPGVPIDIVALPTERSLQQLFTGKPESKPVRGHVATGFSGEVPSESEGLVRWKPELVGLISPLCVLRFGAPLLEELRQFDRTFATGDRRRSSPPRILGGRIGAGAQQGLND